MAANPVLVKNTVTVTWDGVSQRIPAGTVLDSPAAGALLTAIAAANYTTLQAAQLGGAPGPDEMIREQSMRNGGMPYAYQN